MTFSDEKIIEFVNQNFVAAWESVAPVSLATFDLGNGKKLTGAYGGNIALYLCDTRGRVLDVLPALQTPTVTLQWLHQSRELAARARRIREEALDYALASFHARRAEQPDLKPDRVTETLQELPLKSGAVFTLPPERTEPLREMVGKSMAVPQRTSEKILVVVAGGLAKYTKAVDRFLGQGKLRTPEECTKHVFESVLGEKLEGRKDVFVTDEPASIALPDED